MGHRANFVIIENQGAIAYYDNWGAMGCLYAFVGGPREAAAAVAQMEPVTELLDWAFAEGGYLIDHDRKTAIVFGAPFDDVLDVLSGEEGMDEEVASLMNKVGPALEVGPRAYLELAASAWPGWQLIWDERGIDAFSAHLRSRQIDSIAMSPDSHPATTAPPEQLQA